MSVAGICALSVCAAVTALYLKELRPDMARLLSLAAGLCITAAVLPMSAEFISGIASFGEISAPLAEFMRPLIRICGIAYIAQFSAELCRDAGESALAGRVELAGKTAITLMSFPIIKEVFLSLMRIVGG